VLCENEDIDMHILVIDTPMGMFPKKIICAGQALIHYYSNLPRQTIYV